ncbi:hypothetical protein QCA50_008940 [Cerrena zonata]|uniref:Uncharacterized protein n=1 Tax=Cerrena zonata TaxID=2478898 RepID=A0AAW0G8N6_9APHY
METSIVPSWPSLYNFLIEVVPFEGRDPIQPAGKYLYDPEDVYHFTLYWTIVFYIPLFALGGAYAFLNLTFPPSRSRRKSHKTRPQFPGFQSTSPSYTAIPPEIPMQRFGSSLSPEPGSMPNVPKPRQRLNEGRSRLTFALIVFLVFLFFAIAGAVVGSAIIGYVLAGLFKAAHYNMSTWIPFLAGLIQTLIGLIGLWPTIIDII